MGFLCKVFDHPTITANKALFFKQPVHLHKGIVNFFSQNIGIISNLRFSGKGILHSLHTTMYSCASAGKQLIDILSLLANMR